MTKYMSHSYLVAILTVDRLVGVKVKAKDNFDRAINDFLAKNLRETGAW
jgi:hypothetical protein